MGVEFKTVILKCQNYDNIKRIAILCDCGTRMEADLLRENADCHGFYFCQTERPKTSGEIHQPIANLCGFSMRSFDSA